jgi:serine/threonine protein kinase
MDRHQPLFQSEFIVSIGRDFIGAFQLLRLIRSGTSTQVWEALRTGEKERIALKVLLQDYRKDRHEIDQLKHEAAVGTALKHPNVIQIFGYHEDQGYPLLAMQLSSAKNLKIVLREQPELIAANVGPVIRGCAKGLQHLHNKGWVHCDVKPDNFLADDEANIKLIDFSIAIKTQKRKKGLGKLFSRKPKQAAGTRSYMAPEQIRREPLDLRCDMYGFGCVMFELLAKRTPFSGTSPDDLLNRHLHQSPPSLEAVSDSSKEFAAIVRKMMAKSPDDRYDDMTQLLSDLAKTEIYKAGKRPEGYKR